MNTENETGVKVPKGQINYNTGVEAQSRQHVLQFELLVAGRSLLEHNTRVEGRGRGRRAAGTAAA